MAHGGGLIALVEGGGLIEFDIPARRIHLAAQDAVIEQRRQHWLPL